VTLTCAIQPFTELSPSITLIQSVILLLRGAFRGFYGSTVLACSKYATILRRHSVPTSQEKCCVSITKADLLTQFSEINGIVHSRAVQPSKFLLVLASIVVGSRGYIFGFSKILRLQMAFFSTRREVCL
jgi:hypothetical protein